MHPTDPYSPRKPLIEPLEQRIAPALLVNGANLLGGAGNPTIGQGSIGGNALTLVKVLSGEAIVWFDHGSITAISAGPDTSLDIWGDIGFIIGNLNADGKLSNLGNNPAAGLNGDVLLPNDITGITTHPLTNELGSIGAIITGGSISNLNISGNLEGAYAGNGAFYTGNANALLDSRVLSGGVVSADTYVDTNPILPTVQASFFFQASSSIFESGASISNVKMGAAEELQMFAGDGAAGKTGSPGHPGTPGTPGGSITNITISNAFIDVGLDSKTPSYNLMAGKGGNGTRGGAGGSVLKINEISSNGVVDLFAGAGGNGSAGPGGAGGSIKGLNMESVSSAYTVLGGKGGTGAPGGAGGSVTGVNFGGNVLSNGIVVAAPFTGGSVDDLLLIDSLTGSMVIEQNEGTGFMPVVQDINTNLTTIAPAGQTPIAAVPLVIGGVVDIVVAYKNSESLGVYLNQGGGVFYTADFSSSMYTGDTLDANTVALPFAPTQLAAGNFTGDGNTDLAVIANNGGSSLLLTLTGDGKGDFTVPTVTVPLPSNPVSLVTATVLAGYSNLYVGFQSGLIDGLFATGSASGAPFTAVNSGVTVGGGILNLDYNPQIVDGMQVGPGLLLSLNGAGNTLNLYESGVGGTLVTVTSISLAQNPGTALVAHFVPEQQSPAQPIEVLTSISSGTRLDLWLQENATFVLTASTYSTENLKNFVPVIEGATTGVAAVGGSVEHFAFSQNGAPFYDVSLPFSGKKVTINAGDGGAGVNGTTNIAAGGAGGAVFGMNILAGDITVQGGMGGAGSKAPSGAGGSVSNTPVLVTILGQSLPTILEADFVLSVTAGNGGTATGASHAATGGAGGLVTGLNLSLLEGDMLINSGNGGDGSGGAGGSGGMIAALKTIDYAGDLSVTAGHGGAAGALGNGGAGGSILNLNHTLTLTNQAAESPYNVGLTAGDGGTSIAGFGGAGGTVSGINLSLQPSNESVDNPNGSPATVHTDTDTTLRVAITSGNGNDGAIGGAGGAIKNINSNSLFDQVVIIVGATAADTTTFFELNPVTAQFSSGHGGDGSKGSGGAGGAISALTLAGITRYDPDPSDPNAGDSPLDITSGYGGDGTTAGGAGGAITNITSLNAKAIIPTGNTGTTGTDDLSRTELAGATIISGHGGKATTGNGGAGGAIANLSVGVEGFAESGYLTLTTKDLLGRRIEYPGRRGRTGWHKWQRRSRRKHHEFHAWMRGYVPGLRTAAASRRRRRRHPRGRSRRGRDQPSA